MAPRADAERNRERILRVAYEALAADPDASLNSIAKQAGIGPGTLYRHFPSREALMIALYQSEIASLVDEVPTLLATHEPLDAFRLWFRQLAALLRVKHGLGDAINSEAGQQVVDQTYAPVNAAIGRLLEACAATGDLRSGVDPMDVLTLLGALWRVPGDAAGIAQADRLLEVVIAGLRA